MAKSANTLSYAWSTVTVPLRSSSSRRKRPFRFTRDNGSETLCAHCVPELTDADRVEIGKVFPKVRIVETKTYSTAIERDSEPQPKPESKEIGTFEESPHLDVQFALRRLLFRYIEDTFKGKILPCAQIVVEGWLKSKYSPYPNSTKVCDDCFNSMVNFVTELVDEINANEPEGFADLVRDQVIRVNYADSVN